MKETKKDVKFIVELYELEFYWGTNNGFKHIYNYDSQSYEKIKATHYHVTRQCYKRTHYEVFHSEHKLNKALELKRKKYYWFNKSLEDAIKGQHGFDSYFLRNIPQTILVVKQLHDLDNTYSYYKK